MTPADLDLDHLRSWIGRQDQATDLLTPTLVARLNATLDRDDPTAHGAEAPVLIHHCLCQPAVPTAELGPDGHPARGAFLPPVPLPRRMWASGDITIHAPLRIGDEVTRRSEISDVSLKTGRSGRLCFVTVTHEISTGGDPRLTETQIIVYRDAAPSSPPPTAPPPAPQGTEHRQIGTEPERLFRYSALTFNSHRIHYDAPYATSQEHYPGLVVHGPFQAMVLAHYARDLKGTAPRRFRFRGLAPLFSGAPMEMHATPTATGLDLWTTRPGAPMAMQASADW